MSNINEEGKRTVFYVSQTRGEYENQNRCLQGGINDVILNSVKKGDVIIHYQHVQPGNKGKRQIAAVSVATGETEEVEVVYQGKPALDLRVKVELYKLNKPFDYNKEKNAEMVENARKGRFKNIPFNLNGTGVQKYITIMTKEMADYYLGLIMKNEPELSNILK